MRNYFTELKNCYLIAEIGVNHNGSMDLAREMIDAAKSSGADAVKFQTFSAEKLVSRETPKVRYQESTTSPDESHFEMIQKLELSREDHFLLKEYTEESGMDFLSTPYDIESARFLNEELDVSFFKTASADIVDLPLHHYIASTGKPSVVSVGMASLGEVEAVTNVYREYGNNDLILLHCVSNYPCKDDSLNLSVMNTLKQAFQLPIGYSDHSVGTEAAVLSIALGAKMVEKHFTLDKGLPGPDHRASSTPREFAELAEAVRRAEVMMGIPTKQCQDEEKQMLQVSRKSICMARDVAEHSTIQEQDVTLKRPGTGLPASFLPWIIGKTASRALKQDEMLNILDLQ